MALLIGGPADGQTVELTDPGVWRVIVPYYIGTGAFEQIQAGRVPIPRDGEARFLRLVYECGPDGDFNFVAEPLPEPDHVVGGESP